MRDQPPAAGPGGQHSARPERCQLGAGLGRGSFLAVMSAARTHIGQVRLANTGSFAKSWTDGQVTRASQAATLQPPDTGG
jgi:hypothetical protein